MVLNLKEKNLAEHIYEERSLKNIMGTKNYTKHYYSMCTLILLSIKRNNTKINNGNKYLWVRTLMFIGLAVMREDS